MRKAQLLLMGLFMSFTAMAAPVTLQQAKQRAQQFMNRRGTVHGMYQARQQPLHLELAQQRHASYYVFNVGEQQGFVIVSGDDRTPEILGYSREGSFSAEDMPDNMRAWLQGYDDQLKWMEAHPDQQAASNAAAMDKGTVRTAHAVRSSISPLLTSHWDQGKPYNRETPIGVLTTVNDQHGNYVRTDTTFCLTGCVATTLAQVMYYHRWPEGSTQPIPAYNSGWGTSGSTLPSTSNELPSTSFDWSKMRDSYTQDDFAPELAKLMRYCGQAVQMNYNTGSSGAQSNKIANALKDYFDYDNTTTFISRTDFTAEQWSQTIYNELKAGRPVVYGGQSSGGGHEFVIDGYDEDERYHINWGWGGFCDGYFLLAVANPKSSNGSGSSNSNDGYSFSQDATIGIQPQKGTPAATPLVTCKELTATDATTTLSASGFLIRYKYNYGNYNAKDGTFDVALGLFDEQDQLLQQTIIEEKQAINHNGYYYGSGSCYLAQVTNGTYYIKMVSKVSGTDTWQKAIDADLYAIKAVVAGNQMTFTNAVLPTIALSHDGTITSSGTLETNSTITLSTTVTNSGTGLFNDYLYLIVNGQLAGGKIFELKGGATKAFNIEYIPTTGGQKTVVIATDKSGQSVVATGTITVTQPETGPTTSDVELTFAQKVINAEGKEVLGNTAQVKITVTNNTSSNYSGDIYLYTWIWKGGSGQASGTGFTEYIPANSTVELIRTSKQLTGGDRYSFTTSYNKSGTNVMDKTHQNDFYTPTEAYTIYDTAGKATIKKAGASLTIPADVAAVDLRGQSVVTSITSQANPNTLFLVDEGASLSGATNIITNGEAETIALTDGYDFYTPIAFTAQHISLSHTANKAFASGSGWQTITLPFNVEAVTVAGGDAIDWFHSSSDKGKNFWVMEFSGDDDSQVYFDYADQMNAYTPYIFTVPGDNYNEKWRLKGKTLVFTGSNAQVKASSDARSSLTGSSYKFVGTTSKKSGLANSYLLDDEGSFFTRVNDGSVGAFRAYFAPTTYQNAAALNIAIGSGTSTGIADMVPQQESVKTGIYLLNGMKAGNALEDLPAGIYIINGKKVIK